MVSLPVSSLRGYLAASIAARGLKQSEVARQLGMTTVMLSRVINGQSISIQWIIPIAQWCCLTPDELWTLLSSEVPEGE